MCLFHLSNNYQMLYLHLHLHFCQATDSESSQKTDVTQPASQTSEVSGSEDGGQVSLSPFNPPSAQVQPAASGGEPSAEGDEGDVVMCV